MTSRLRLFFLVLTALPGCPTPPATPVEACNGADDDADGSTDEGTATELGCAEGQECLGGECLVASPLQLDSVDSVDLLLVVDNSNSMLEEQDILRTELPDALHVLVTTDSDSDGTPDVASLHVGIVTTDLGAGPALPVGETVPTCDFGFGDDGILLSTSERDGCPPAFPPIFDFVPGVTDPATYVTDVACVTSLGTGGCGFEQQLEVALKALSPARPTDWVSSSYVAPVFAGMVDGHGDGANDGFSRPGSVLALALVTDEEDCSVPDYGLFYRNDPRFSSASLNLRCFTFPEAMYGIDRYVEGFLQLRESPSLLVYGAITGVPPDLVEAGQDYDAWLADPRMIETPDPEMPTIRLSPACSTTGRGIAFPARRIVAVGRELAARGAGVSIGSICADTYGPPLEGLVGHILDRLGGACLPFALPTDDLGRVPCRLIETLPFGSTCDGLAGRTALGTVRVGDSILFRCELAQDETIGWSYDDSSAEVLAECGAGGQTIRLDGVELEGTATIYCDPGAIAP